MAAAKRKKRLYMIGMDSTPLWVLNELKGQRGMEPFREFMAHGRITSMESTMPPITGPAWPSIYTGLAPPDHGVPDFFTMKRDYSPEIVFYDSRKHPPFWENMAAAGLKCMLLTPATEISLPKSRRIDSITGFPLEPKFSSPRLESVARRHGFKGEPEVEKEIKDGNMTVESAAKVFRRTSRQRVEVAMDLIEGGDYDFVFVCFTETDRLQHFVMGRPDYKRYVLPVYAEIASLLSCVMERSESEGGAVVLVSDHGMQPIHNKFLLNSFLEREGYIRLGRQAAAQVSALRSMPKGRQFTRVHPLDFDMESTKAFGAIAYDPVTTIWINDRRFWSGAVGARDKPAVKRRLIETLKRARSAEGDAMFVSVTDSDYYYKGTKKFIAPDIFAEAKKGYTVDIFNFSPSGDFMPPEAPKSGDHLRHGIFGFYPRKVGIADRDFSVLNVAPTVLDYFGVPAPGKIAQNSRLKK